MEREEVIQILINHAKNLETKKKNNMTMFERCQKEWFEKFTAMEKELNKTREDLEDCMRNAAELEAELRILYDKIQKIS